MTGTATNEVPAIGTKWVYKNPIVRHGISVWVKGYRRSHGKEKGHVYLKPVEGSENRLPPELQTMNVEQFHQAVADGRLQLLDA